jgi:hypothetical protein
MLLMASSYSFMAESDEASEASKRMRLNKAVSHEDFPGCAGTPDEANNKTLNISTVASLTGRKWFIS